MDDKTELKKIREEFKASRPQFGEVFLGGISRNTLYLYETGQCKIPAHIMMLARIWKTYLNTMKGSKNNAEN